MNTKRAFRSVLIFMLMLCIGATGLWAAGGSQASAGKPELVWSFVTWGTTPADISKVEAAINAHLETKVDFKIKLLPIGIAEVTQRLNLMLASPTEPLDIFFMTGAIYMPSIARGQLVPMNDLLASDGQGILREVGEKYLLACRKDGIQYSVPSIRDMASGMGFLITKEYVDKYNLNVSSVKRVEDVTPILAAIKRNEPNFYPMTMNVGFEVTRSLIFDPLSDNFGVLMVESPDKVVNLFETPQYRQRIELYRSWYEAGYISPDAAASTETAVAVMRAGKAVAQFTANKPGIQIENELSTGRNLVYADINEAVLTTGGVQGLSWGIANNTKNPKRAMQLLNLLFTDPVLINLINYGIEGEHYVKRNDGTIGFPAGIDASNAKYNLGGMDWQLGNSYLSYPWEGKPADLPAQMKAFNERAIVSPAYGFEFDNDRVRTQIAALTAVSEQYRRALETGSADISMLAEFNSRLYAAGLSDVIAEKQRQLDAWRSSGR